MSVDIFVRTLTRAKPPGVRPRDSETYVSRVVRARVRRTTAAPRGEQVRARVRIAPVDKNDRHVDEAEPRRARSSKPCHAKRAVFFPVFPGRRAHTQCRDSETWRRRRRPRGPSSVAVAPFFNCTYLTSVRSPSALHVSIVL